MIEQERGDHTVITPNTSFVYKSKLTTSDLSFIKELAENSRNNDTFGKNLAGNILEQRSGAGMNIEQQQKLFSIFSQHVEHFVKYERQQEQINGFNVEAVWFNYMKANEFNPLHSHSGYISGIVMVDVPLEIAEELNEDIETNARCPGHLEFVCDRDIHRVSPIEGEIYLFRSDFKHQVYPFKSMVERITMSWNITEAY